MTTEPNTEPNTIDDPAVVAEVREVFERYERALVANDIDALDALFWDDERVVRLGVGENLYGAAEIAAFRRARVMPAGARRLRNTRINTFGFNTASAITEYCWEGSDTWGRQSQVWVRMPDGWRVVAAHVSLPKS